MKKKIQVFVSSTYTDLQSERQSAVQAILDAGHIPAGMELFRAGSDSQLDTVKKWIKDSDAYLLILGGRYGSIEPTSRKSYTHVEYEYALSIGIPIFSLVLSDSFLQIKAAGAKGYSVYETEDIDGYAKFKEIVMSKIVRLVNDEKEIQIEIFRTLPSLMDDNQMSGWVRGIDTSEYERLKVDKVHLLEENAKLLKKIQTLEERTYKSETASKDRIGDYSFEELKGILSSHKIEVPADLTHEKKKDTRNAYDLFINTYSMYATGLDNARGMSDMARFLYFDLAPILISYGLLERVKLPASLVRIQASALGSKFFARAKAIPKKSTDK